MKVLPAAVTAKLETGCHAVRFALRFDLATGPEGIWTDTFEMVHGGLTYYPVGSSLAFSATPGAVGLNADQLEVTTTGLSAKLNAVIAARNWHQRPATLYRVFLDDAGAVLHVEAEFSGFLDHVSVSDVGDGLSAVALRIESNSRELNRAIGRTRSDNDQRQHVDSADAFYSFVGAVAAQQEIYWGRKGPQNPFR